MKLIFFIILFAIIIANKTGFFQKGKNLLKNGKPSSGLNVNINIFPTILAFATGFMIIFALIPEIFPNLWGNWTGGGIDKISWFKENSFFVFSVVALITSAIAGYHYFKTWGRWSIFFIMIMIIMKGMSGGCEKQTPSNPTGGDTAEASFILWRLDYPISGDSTVVYNGLTPKTLNVNYRYTVTPACGSKILVHSPGWPSKILLVGCHSGMSKLPDRTSSKMTFEAVK